MSYIFFIYYEPSGLVETVTGPQPGTAGMVLSSYAYDGLGNVTSMTMPGPNSTPAASGAPLRPASAPALAAQTTTGGTVDIARVRGWRVVYFWSATCPCVKACERYSLVPLAGKYKGRVSFFAVASDGWDLTQPQKTLRAEALAGKPVTPAPLKEAGCVIAW